MEKSYMREFNPTLVLSPFTCKQANVGDWGYTADDKRSLIKNSENESMLVQIVDIDEVSDTPFYVGETYWRYFYPSPYHERQEDWVNKVNLEVGSKVIVKQTWLKNDKGFRNKCLVNNGETYEVVGIEESLITVCDSLGMYAVPDFCLEKVEHEVVKYIGPTNLVLNMTEGNNYKVIESETTYKIKDDLGLIVSISADLFER